MLFKKETFSSEFKELLGFVDTDMSFRRLKSALQSAEMEITDIIGKSAYDEIKNENASEEFSELVKYAIALKAYILYAPTADLAVTNNGRLMRRDEHTVSAFQWQIDANDEGLERLYYRHLDTLLRYMQEHHLAVNQAKYNHAGLIVQNLSVFENFFNIEGSHYLYLKLIPALREFEQMELKPRIGDFSVLSKDATMLYNAQNAAVCYAMAWGIRRLNIQLFPKGVLQTSQVSNQGKNNNSAQKLEYWETAKIFEDDYAKYLLKIEKYMESQKPKNDNANIQLPEIGFCEGDAFVDV